MQRIFVLVLAGCGLLWLSVRKKAEEERTEDPTVEVEAVDTASAPKPDSAWPTAPVDLRLPSTQVAEHAPGMKSWFTPVKFQSAERYPAPRPVPVEWDASCKGNPSTKTKEFSKLIKERTGLIAAAQYPKNGYVIRFHQFWKIGTQHFQLSARTNQGEPPLYSLEYYSADSPDLERNVRALPIPTSEPGQLLDIEGVYDLTKKLLKQAKEKGGVEGARHAVFLALGTSDNDPPREAHFLNERPLQYIEDAFSCQLGANEKSARCECAPPAGSEAGK